MRQGMSRRDWTRTLAAVMTALTVCLLVMNQARSAELEAANARVSAAMQKAFYETCEMTEAMSVNLRKLLVAGERGQMQQLLGEISRQAQGSAGDLAMLPMGEEEVSAAIRFINQVGDYAEGLSVRLAGGGAVGTADYETISKLSEGAAAFSIGMGELLAKVERGETMLSPAPLAGGESVYPLSAPAAEYPTLLYDGPFSDGAKGGVYRALEGLPEVTADQARQSLIALLGEAEGVALTGESSEPTACYEFEVTAGGYPLSAGVTKQGGRVLYVLSDADVTEMRMDVQQLLDAAQTFLLSRGFGQMEMSYYSRHDGILTVNYAAVQDGVVLYPDLVKVQLSMRDGAVIGLEAGNYLMNHVERALQTPTLTEEEAAARIGGRLTPLATRLCVIPVGTAEALCYEVRATDGASTYLVYIDAATGTERELMQVVSDEYGSLVM